MPTLNFIIKNKKNKGLVMNSRELLTLYFYGIDIVNRQGTGISDTTFDTYIRSAQEELERYLTIKIQKQVIEERSDYYREEFQGTGFVRTKYMVNKALTVAGFLGDQKQLEYPDEWFTENQVEGLGNARQVLIVPNSNTPPIQINNAIFAGAIIPYLGLVNSRSIGSYFRLSYITGFGCNQLPYDLFDVIGKWAAMKVFNLLGDIVLGAPAVASQSLSLDNLSQSISTTASATSAGYSARIIQYTKEIKDTLKRLEGTYKGLSLTSI